MIKIENVTTAGWEPAIRGMRNPLNSWNLSDSECLFHMMPNFSDDDPKAEEYERYLDEFNLNLKIGPKDHKLMMNLRNAGSDHRKYMRMIEVWCDITAPLYWWKEFDTYKVATVANSCSTMHKIHAKEFTLDDFSHEHLGPPALVNLKNVIKCMNDYREEFLKDHEKHNWWQMIQLLPTSYNQKRTVMLPYEVLTNMYHARKNHKLDEWHVFCNWVENLPYSEIITGEER